MSRPPNDDKNIHNIIHIYILVVALILYLEQRVIRGLASDPLIFFLFRL